MPPAEFNLTNFMRQECRILSTLCDGDDSKAIDVVHKASPAMRDFAIQTGYRCTDQQLFVVALNAMGAAMSHRAVEPGRLAILPVKLHPNLTRQL